MAFKHADRVKETSTTTGTGTYSLLGAVTGFQTFVAGIATGNTCYYVAEDGINWEIGIGTITDATPDTLARTSILASSNAGAAVNWSAGTRNIFCALPSSGLMPRGHIWDLTLSNAADTTNDITIAAGEARDDTGTVDITLTSAITKQIDAVWAVGTNAGGLNTGSVANSTWYEVHLIKRIDTGVVDVMFTTTANRATLPTNYTHKRRIGWVRRGSSTLLQFTQVDDYFTLTTQINDQSVTTTLTAAAIILTVPPNSIARFRANLQANIGGATGAATTVVFSEIVEGNVTPATTTGISSLSTGEWIASNVCAVAGHFELRVNASSQIEHDSDVAGGTFDISTFGWIDHREKMSAT